jgi:hypothetical protein
MLTDKAKQNQEMATMETGGKFAVLAIANGHQICGCAQASEEIAKVIAVSAPMHMLHRRN